MIITNYEIIKHLYIDKSKIVFTYFFTHFHKYFVNKIILQKKKNGGVLNLYLHE